MEAVRRCDDGELCGYVEHRGGCWVALAVFGAVLGSHPSAEGARRQVLEQGLASLTERWLLRQGTNGDEEIVCIVEASTNAVTLARGYYSMPGVPTLTVTSDEILSGAWELRRS